VRTARPAERTEGTPLCWSVGRRARSALLAEAFVRAAQDVGGLAHLIPARAIAVLRTPVGLVEFADVVAATAIAAVHVTDPEFARLAHVVAAARSAAIERTPADLVRLANPIAAENPVAVPRTRDRLAGLAHVVAAIRLDPAVARAIRGRFAHVAEAIAAERDWITAVGRAVVGVF